jgi:hypothetical protein
MSFTANASLAELMNMRIVIEVNNTSPEVRLRDSGLHLFFFLTLIWQQFMGGCEIHVKKYLRLNFGQNPIIKFRYLKSV